MTDLRVDRLKGAQDTMDFAMKVLSEFMVLVLCLSVIGFLMQDKMTKLLNGTMEQSIARQTADFSLLAEERFNREIAELSYAARYAESHPDSLGEVVAGFESNIPGTKSGLLSLYNGTVVGDEVDYNDFAQLNKAFRGSAIVDYCAGRGLLFAVPVYRGDNVRYVLYRIYAEKELSNLFGLEEYDANSRILILEKNGKLVVPYANYGEKDREFFADAAISADFERMREKLAVNKSAAVYSEGEQGRFFLFGADLPQTNCSMIGYVPWEAVAGGISRIYTLVLLVVSLLLVIFAVVSVYIFLVQAKVAESDALRSAKEMADRASAAKSHFLAQMSHEIRTPINAVLGMNEMILRESTESHIQTYAQKIGSAGQALLSLINDILDFSKIESGRMELVESRYHLDSLLNDIINIVEPRMKEKSLDFRVNIAQDIPNELRGDGVRVRQIIINLLTNAVKYTPSGSVELQVAKEALDEHDITLQVTVKDTGIGIRDEDKQRLFRDFERLDTVKNRNIEGTGLGLAITYKLLQLMKGTIKVESEYGKGTVFGLAFPQRVLSFEPISDFAARIRHRRAQGNEHHTSFIAPKARILVVDDNEVNIFVVQNLLKETKIQVSTCLSGAECLATMQHEHFDVILLDQMMPEMDGVETLEKIKTTVAGFNVPVIALTANAVAGAREMFLAAGFSDYITKPVSGKKLEDTLMKYLPEDKVLAEKTNDATQEYDKATTVSATQLIDCALGLSYNGGMKEMYAKVLAMFAQLKDGKKEKMSIALQNNDWKSYTTFVHALKSTSLTIGCRELSEQAKALEIAGKQIIENVAKAGDNDGAKYISSHHDKVMELYDQVAVEAQKLSVA